MSSPETRPPQSSPETKGKITVTLYNGKKIEGPRFNLGMVSDTGVLSARFQVFLKSNFNVPELESLAIWIADNPDKMKSNSGWLSNEFNSDEKIFAEWKRLADLGSAKVDWDKIPFLDK